MSQIGVLGMKISEPNTICKFLYFVPKKFTQMTCSIETLLEHDTLSVEELIGQLKAAKERYELEEPKAKQAVKLLLSEGKWFARMKLRHGGVLSSQGGRRGSNARGREAGKGKSGAQGTDDGDKCRYCRITSHRVCDLCKKIREEALLGASHSQQR
jgi:hypothetical protein